MKQLVSSINSGKFSELLDSLFGPINSQNSHKSKRGGAAHDHGKHGHKYDLEDEERLFKLTDVSLGLKKA